jgi:autotransporter-associated beta strand protein
MKSSSPSQGGLVVRIPAALVLVSSLSAAPVSWDNGGSTGAWSLAANWDPDGEPTAADDVTFPTGLAGAITTASTENALSLTFNDAYTLSGGTLALASGNHIHVANGVTATIQNVLSITGGLEKTGGGTLALSALNTNPGGTVIAAGTLRVSGNASALGAATAVTTVQGGATLEVSGGYTLDRPVSLMQGGTVAGFGAATSNGKIMIDAAATSVTLATAAAGDVLAVGNGANDLTGGGVATVIGLSGPGTVRLGAASDFDGSWSLPSGRLELGATGALGDQAASSVTLSGGTLSARLASASTFLGPAGNLGLTADSGLLSDRSGVGAGVNHTFGTLAMGDHVLTVAPGANATSGTATITLGNVTLTGNPTFAVNDSGATNGKLATGSLLGGAARSILKTGAGDLSVTGGATDLPAGSSFSASGGGVVEMLFAPLGADSTAAIGAAQNPFGAATIAIADGTLRLAADGNGTAVPQTYALPSVIALAGDVTLDPDRRTAGTLKTYELTGLTLAGGTELAVAGANSHGIRVSGPLALSGDAVLKGAAAASKAGLLTLGGGISGAAGDSLAIQGGTSPLNLTINASSSYGGGTAMSGGNVTLNAANGFGPGATTVSGGTLTLNANAALAGTVVLNGGALVVNGANRLATNPVVLSGGTLDLREDASTGFAIPALTVSGNSGINVARLATGSGAVLNVPALLVSGDSTLTLSSANSFVPNFTNIELAGNLTFNHNVAARVQSVSEDGFPRAVLKTGTGTLNLQAASTHSGGTEVLAGILDVEHAGALGGGALTVGATSGTATATAIFAAGLAIPNDIVIRGGSSGAATLDAEGGLVTWNGGMELQKTVTLENGGAIASVATFGGLISGGGDLLKTGAGEIKLAHAANSFGGGSAGSVTVSAGPVSVDADGALGDPANGVTVAGTTGALKIDGSFATSRTLTFTGTSSGASSGILVSPGQELTVNSPMAGTGTLRKSGAGILTLAPGVDSSGRGISAPTIVSGGVLRVQGVKNLGDAGPITAASGGTIAFLRDADTAFGYRVVPDGTTGVIHVDRAIGGSGVNGRHTLGNVLTASGDLTVTGDNGYGLSLGNYEATASPELINHAPGTLIVASIFGNPGSGSPTLTVGGSGDLQVTGPIGVDLADSGSYGLTKSGAGTFTAGSSLAGFARIVTVQDGTLDLNGLTHAVNALTFGGAASADGATLVTGATGAVQLGGTLTLSSAASMAGARFNGNLDLGAAPRNFVIGNPTSAAVDLTIDGLISGGAGAAIVKSGAGTLRLSGAGNTQPGPLSVSAGVLELGKTSGVAVGVAGLNLTGNGAVVRLVAGEQIHDAAPLAIGDSGFFELDGFTETTGPITFTQATPNQYAAIKTGAAGTLVLGGDLFLHNNSNNPSTTNERNILITGSGTKSLPTTTGTLDLGGATRVIHVATTTVGVNEPRANATIETRIINGGIVKSGPRTLFLGHPDNSFGGGLQIAEGTVKVAGTGSLGTGPVAFTASGGASATLDLGAASGVQPGDYVVGGSGSGTVSLVYSGPKPQELELSGHFDLQRDLTVTVVNGSIYPGDSATLRLSGTIDDGAEARNLVKTGDGTLALAAGNSYGGATTVTRGILAIPADSALGNGNAALTLDGACLHATDSFASGRNLVLGAGGGAIRVNAPHVHEWSGNLAWSGSLSSFDGSGTTILSGTTSGGGGDLSLGEPMPFTSGGGFGSVATFHTLSLRGTAALPAGNLRFDHFAVLELGNGNFTRALGSGPGEVQLVTALGAGWAAHGADRGVNLGGAGAPVVWGEGTPAFLSRFGSAGQLVLGSPTATHTVDFQNPIAINDGTDFFPTRRIFTRNGGAAIDGRISGDLSNGPPAFGGSLEFAGDGTLEIGGDLIGDLFVRQNGVGTTRLSGDNRLLEGTLDLNEGRLVIASNDSLGQLADINVAGPAFLDASAMTLPVEVRPGNHISLHGTILGDVKVAAAFGSLGGTGTIDGDLATRSSSTVYPETGGRLHITGDLDLVESSTLVFYLEDVTPQTGFTQMRVGGAVNLDGTLGLDTSFDFTPPDGFTGTLALILNDGSDPINGTFDGYEEGDVYSVGGPYAFKVTYLANGDGGPVGNDFGLTVVEDGFSTDLGVTLPDPPVAVEPGAPITLQYFVGNSGPNDSTGGSFVIQQLPANAPLVDFPANADLLTIPGGLIIPLPPLAAFNAVMIPLGFDAPGAEGSVVVVAEVTGPGIDGNPSNDQIESRIAVLAGGAPVLDVFEVNAANDRMTLGIDTIEGISYLLESTIDLEDWDDYWYFEGDGLPQEFVLPMDLPREFFRFRILPYSGGGGGTPE